ncbi:MAG TPA: GAF domain-containing sensor histidine kinase [Steroidobacteraceae bacterium]|nr:GAF domain-containing sensor histidine kinase [Steroidobacteraceae bacterium]
MELVRDPLLDAVTALASARDEAGVCNIVRRAARELTGADGVTFVLRRGNHCYYADEDAIGPLWKGRQFPIETCISGWAMIHRQHVVIPDIYSDDRIPHDAYRPTFVKSLMMMPVRREDPIAAIGAYWATYHVATPMEIGVLQSLADAAALALYNVQLDANLKEALRHEREARVSAESASRLKDEFLALLSHELRTPLHVINNWLWQLKQGKSIPPMILSRALDVIERNTALQSRLVDDLLDVSRAAAGKMSIDSQLVQVGTLCASVVELSQPAAREKSIALTLTLTQKDDPRIWGDPDRLQQVLNNVVSNAIKFSTKGGRVDVQVSREGSLVSVVVKDEGEGVPADFLPHMFDRFRQADASMTRRQGGLGLGLTIVREIMSLHGGTVRAESAGPGKGTTIYLEFAVAEEPQAGSDVHRPSLHPKAPVH